MSVSLPPSSPFFVAPSCVYDGGLGLFAKADTRFRKGDLLPFQYPGVHVSRKTFEACNDYLHELTNKKLTARETEAAVQKLFQVHGIALSQTFGVATPNWDQIYDGFISYSMHLCQNDCFVFWRSYAYDGNVIPDQRKNTINAAHSSYTHDMTGMYMNETPPYTYFHNGQSGHGKLQRSRPNVDHKVEQNKDGNYVVQFRALEDIEPFDELIYFYGLFNRRDYDINWSTVPEAVVNVKELCKKDRLEYAAIQERIAQYKDKGYVYVARPWRPSLAAAQAAAGNGPEWTLMPCKCGVLSGGNLTLEQTAAGTFATRGSIGWSTGVHRWTVQADADAAGIYVGVGTSHNSCKTHGVQVIACLIGAMVLQETKDMTTTVYLSVGAKKGQKIKVTLDLDKRTIMFAMDAMAPTKAFMLSKGNAMWYPHVGMTAKTAKFTIVEQE